MILRILILLLSAAALHGQTAKTRAALYTQISTQLASGQPITALQLRTVFLDVVASGQNGLTDGTALVSSGSYANPLWLTSLDWSKITSKPTLGSASALDVAASGNAASGQVVKGDDSRLADARTPTTHGHAIADTTGLQAALDGKLATGGTAADVNPAGTAIAAALAGKLGTSGTAADVNPAGTAIAAALSGKLGTSGTAADVNVSGTAIAAALAGKLGTSGTAADVNVSGTAIAAALAGKLSTSGTAADVNVSGTAIAAALSGKAATSHTHTASNVTDFNSSARAQVEAALVAGTNVTLTPSGSGASRQITIAATGGGGGGMTNPMTTAGDMIAGGASGTPERVPASTQVGSFPGVNATGGVEFFDDAWAVVRFDILNHTLATSAAVGTASSGHAGSAIGTFGGEGNTMILTGGTSGTTGATRYWNGGYSITSNRGGIQRAKTTYAEIRTRIYMADISDGTNTYTVLGGFGRVATGASTEMASYLGAHINASGQIAALHRNASVDTFGTTFQLANATTYVLRVTYDGTTTRVFIDGVQVSSVTSGMPGSTLPMVPTFQLIKTAGANARTFAFGTGGAVIKYTP